MRPVLIIERYELAVALRNKQSHAMTKAIYDTLKRYGAEIEPFAPKAYGDPLIKWFRIKVADGNRSALLAALNLLPGVDDARLEPDQPAH